MGEADLGSVVQHKLVGIALHLVETGALTTSSKRLGSALRHIRSGQCAYQNAMLDEASAICVEAARMGIRVAVRKGPVVASWFPRTGDRQFSDIDLLLGDQDKAAITKVLEARGYVPGLYSFATTSLASHSRATQIRYALSPDHLPHFARLDAAAPCGGFNVDVAFTIGWHKDQLALPLQQILSRFEYCDALGIPRLTNEDCAVDTLLHAFRETFLAGTTAPKPPSLQLFVDCRFALAQLAQRGDRGWAHSNRLAMMVAWMDIVVGHVLDVSPFSIGDAAELPCEPWNHSLREDQVVEAPDIHRRLGLL
ncbi:nucleotidyltransferase family protein [Achromobacter sp. MY14]|uniref:nucleotidyltransferase family protein n=1 Tax=unclassified Achromobacter TaxID=2626865 RepID=UPI001E368876|nr:nucleotidyltransferase family protein [Achromobacter sp. MY14]MCD0495530.1 nucleotidyltransferase family protein [Achromobacter sp. MY14]